MDHLGLLERQVAAMTAAISAANPEDAVPACPGWQVRDLVGHIIAVHSWVTATLGNPQPAAYEEQPQPGDAAELAVRYDATGQALLQKLHALPADTPSWSFDDHNRTAGYWRRRQLQELSVHRWDVSPYTIEPEVAAEGIDEAVGFFLPKRVARGDVTLPPGSLRLVTPDRTWTVGEGAPVAVAEGSAGELLLSLWGRADLLPAPWRDAKLMP